MHIKEANKLIRTYISLRNKVDKNPIQQNILALKKQETLCVEKFRYLILIKTSRYKNFNNHEDLIQEGLEALLKAMKSYDPKRGNWFWWLHKYLDTRIARSANLHTAIRYPLKYTKKVTPRRESSLPVLIDQLATPEKMFESCEINDRVQNGFKKLTFEQQKVAKMLFGMDGEKPQSLTSICQKMKISKPTCAKIVNQVFVVLKKNIRL